MKLLSKKVRVMLGVRCIHKYGVVKFENIGDDAYLSVHDTDYPVHYVESFRWPWQPKVIYHYKLELTEGFNFIPDGNYTVDGTLSPWTVNDPMEETINRLKVCDCKVMNKLKRSEAER